MVDKIFVHKTTKLAAIQLTEEEVSSLRTDLTRILSFVEQLPSVPTKDVKPLVIPFHEQASLRKDEVSPDATPGKILENAPQQREDFFLLPKVL